MLVRAFECSACRSVVLLAEYPFQTIERHIGKDGLITPPTKLQTFFFGIRISRVRIDPKHDIDLILRHFHPLDQRTDQVPFARPVGCPPSPSWTLVAKSSRRPIISCNSACEAASSASCLALLLQTGETLAQAGNPGLKLVLVNEAIRITVDQPCNALAQLG